MHAQTDAHKNARTNKHARTSDIDKFELDVFKFVAVLHAVAHLQVDREDGMRKKN